METIERTQPAHVRTMSRQCQPTAWTYSHSELESDRVHNFHEIFWILAGGIRTMPVECDCDPYKQADNHHGALKPSVCITHTTVSVLIHIFNAQAAARVWDMPINNPECVRECVLGPLYEQVRWRREPQNDTHRRSVTRKIAKRLSCKWELCVYVVRKWSARNVNSFGRWGKQAVRPEWEMKSKCTVRHMEV